MTMKWYNKFQQWLSPSQSLHNAQNIINLLYVDGKDWTKESLCALLGNMRHESSINPNMYEYGYKWSADRGFGLVQWTPRSKYWNWAIQKGFKESELRNGEAQVSRIEYEIENGIQYIANGHQRRYGKAEKYNFSFADFRKNTQNLSVNQLTEAFMWNYEGPNYTAGSNSLSDRQAFANRVFKELDFENKSDYEPDDSDDDDGYNPDESLEGIDINAFKKELNDLIKEMVSKDLFQSGNSQYSTNGYLTLIKQLNNTFKVKGLDHFYKAIDEQFKDFNDRYIPDEPTPPTDPDEPEDPDKPPTEEGKRVFPVKIKGGINFFKRSNWGVGTLQRNMTYGQRSTGKYHYGYDIGGGGVKHTIYSITNATVLNATYRPGIGNVVTVKNNDDNYFIEYGHMDSFTVKKGDVLQAGQKIGIMGQTGGNYAIHLDVKISTSSKGFYNLKTSVNPEKYLKINRDNSTQLPQP